MPTNETKVWQALKAKIKSLNLSYPIVYPNQVYTPSSETYVRIRHFPNTTEVTNISRPDDGKYKGILQIELAFAIAKHYTYDVMQEQISIIGANFRIDNRMPFQDINVFLEKKPDILPSYTEDGFLIFPVSIRYYSFINEV